MTIVAFTNQGEIILSGRKERVGEEAQMERADNEQQKAWIGDENIEPQLLIQMFYP